MIFHCPKRKPIPYGWNRWFAWFPVRINNTECRWLEYVERKAIPKTYVNYDDWQRYEYRIKK